jgi:outer membrane protein, multidrug efflux system
LFKSGNDSELDLQQAKAQYLGTLATIPQQEGSLRQTLNALSVLLTRPPGPLPEMTAGKDGIPNAELDIIVEQLIKARSDFIKRPD